MTEKSKEIIALEEKIVEALKTVYDPEIPVNIYEIGLIYEINISEKKEANIVMTLTSPACPVAESLVEEVQVKVGEVEGISRSQVELVFDPPWDMSMMSLEAKVELGFM
jgi:FeS assembly SUF system protein